MKIIWIKDYNGISGGALYGQKARDIIRKKFGIKEIRIDAQKISLRYLKPLEWFFRILRIRENSDIWIMDSVITIAMSAFNRRKGKKIAVVHHIDISTFPFFTRPILFVLKNIFYNEIKKMDAVVTVSEYWMQHFLKNGCKNVFKIYNSLEINDFKFSREEIDSFKKRYGIADKPIVYIGNCQKSKGVVETYKALKKLDVYLVTSSEQRVKIPAKNFNLNYREYLLLLKSASISVNMSKSKEGWSLTVHEAMLCKTPVIGSGFGGMKELLEGGKQIICEDFNNLINEVEYLLENPKIREKMGEDGFNYAKDFKKEKFEKEWLELIISLKNR